MTFLSTNEGKIINIKHFGVAHHIQCHICNAAIKSSYLNLEQRQSQSYANLQLRFPLAHFASEPIIGKIKARNEQHKQLCKRHLVLLRHFNIRQTHKSNSLLILQSDLGKNAGSCVIPASLGICDITEYLFLDKVPNVIIHLINFFLCRLYEALLYQYILN